MLKEFSVVFPLDFKKQSRWGCVQFNYFSYYMINTIASTPSIIWPLFVLLLSISWVVLGITKLKLHPFLTLMIAAVIVGLLSGPLPDPSAENKGLFHDRVDLPSSEKTNYALALTWSLLGFGNLSLIHI